MRAVRFIAIAFPWAIILWMFCSFFILDSSQEWIEQWNNANVRSAYLKNTFRFSDQWNVLALTFFLSVSVIFLSVNDLLTRHLLIKVMGKSALPFWAGGMLWLARTAVNVILFLFEVLVVCYGVSFSYSSSRIVDVTSVTKGRYTVLLLGTSKYLNEKRELNSYYVERIQTCIQLYQQGVIRELVISGDSSSREYDEVEMMYNDLRRIGMHGVKIYFDKKGYRTFDSIRKIKSSGKLSQDSELLIISQYFHLQRALYLAMTEHIRSRGVLAKGSMTRKMVERELLAKTKVLLDVYVLNTQTNGIYSVPRRLVDLSRVADLCLLFFMLALVAIAGRLTKMLLDY